MSEQLSFEMLELASGEVILRFEGDSEGYLLKIDFNKDVSALLGENKSHVCRAMVAAGINATQNLQEQQPRLTHDAPVASNSVDEERLLESFKETTLADLGDNRTLH